MVVVMDGVSPTEGCALKGGLPHTALPADVHALSGELPCPAILQGWC